VTHIPDSWKTVIRTNELVVLRIMGRKRLISHARYVQDLESVDYCGTRPESGNLGSQVMSQLNTSLLAGRRYSFQLKMVPSKGQDDPKFEGI
jgi:hypothetical protein